MNSYIRDDGVEMVETRPGCFTRRDSLGLLDLAPMTRRVAALAQDEAIVRCAVDRVAADVTGPSITPPSLAPTHKDLAPEPVEPPPLQPSFADLVSEDRPAISAASPPCTHHSVAGRGKSAAGSATAPAPPRAPHPKPAKRSIAAILAEADRTHRARRARA